MIYQMTAEQQHVLDDQCDILTPEFTPSDSEIKGLVDALLRLEKLRFPTITLDWEFVAEFASEDTQLNLDIHTCKLRKDYKQARLIEQTYYITKATDLVRGYISCFNQLPRIV